MVPNGHSCCSAELWDVCGEGLTLHALSLALPLSLSSSFLSSLPSLDIFRKPVLTWSVVMLSPALLDRRTVSIFCRGADKSHRHFSPAHRSDEVL